jgi:hypothetical protein
VEQCHTNAPMPLGALAFVGCPLGASSLHARIAAAINALTNGADLRYVQDWIGHASVKKSVIYAQLTPSLPSPLSHTHRQIQDDGDIE